MIGRDITVELLALVADHGPAIIQHTLDTLVNADIMQRRNTGLGIVYAFRHSLIQDAAYSSLLRGRRRQLHARVAEALESEFPERCRDEPEVLANHLSEAGDAMQAGRYWLKAAQQAIERSANREAVSHTGRGLELLTTLASSRERDRLERALQAIRLGPANHVFGFSSDEVEGICKRLHELFRDGDDLKELYLALYGEFLLRLTRAQITQALAVANTMVDITRSFDDQQPYHHSLRNRALAAFFAGEFAGMKHDIEYLDALKFDSADTSQSDFSQASAFAVLNTYKSLLFWCTGFPDQARAAARASLAAAESSSRINIRLFVLILHGILSCLRYDIDSLADVSEQLVHLSSEHRLPNYLGGGRAFQGIRFVANREFGAGIRLLTTALSDLDRIKTFFMRPLFLSWLAVGYAGAQNLAAGNGALREAEIHIRRSGEAVFAPVVQHARGILLLQSDGAADAELAFRRAIEIALSQGARMLALRPTIELGQLLCGQDRADEAAELLVPIRTAFTEGIDLPELQRAMTLARPLAAGIDSFVDAWRPTSRPA